MSGASFDPILGRMRTKDAFTGGNLPDGTTTNGLVAKVSSTFQNFLILDNVSKTGDGNLPSENPTVMPVILLTTNGAQAITLPDSIVYNQVTTIISNGTGTKTITVTTPYGFTNLSLTAIGQSVTLYWIPSSGWAILSNNGATIS